MKPRHALTHPLWLGALGLLILNDHALKGAGSLPGWLTGKLSDFAGMIVAPLLVAVLVRVSERRGWALAHVAVGVVFAAIKLSGAAAQAFEALTALTPFPWVIVVDPTDLLALPALWVSYRVLGRARQAQSRHLESALATAGALACMATSPPPCDEGAECQPPPPPAPQEQAALVLGNATSEQRLVRVRPLRDDLTVSCSAMLADPSSLLSEAHFAPAESWLLDPGRGLPLRGADACSAYLVDAQGLDPVLLAWRHDQFPETQIATDTTPGANKLVMRDAGGRLELDAHPAVFAAPAEAIPAQPGCETPADTVGIDWSEPPSGAYEILSITSSPDGCHLIEVPGEDFVVCLPLAALPFAAGETVDFRAWHATSAYPEAIGTANASGIVMLGPSASVWAVRGDVLARPSDGSYLAERDFDASVTPRGSCGFHHDECANVVQPLDVSIAGTGVDGTVSGGAGEALALNDGTLHIVRAQRMPIRDAACAPYAVQENYLESVLVLPNQGE